jgi:hypothetical protein
MKCRWVTYGWGAWYTTLDSDVTGLYINLDKGGFAVMRVRPMPAENELIATYPDLNTAKTAARKYFFEHLELWERNLPCDKSTACEYAR